MSCGWFISSLEISLAIEFQAKVIHVTEGGLQHGVGGDLGPSGLVQEDHRVSADSGRGATHPTRHTRPVHSTEKMMKEPASASFFMLNFRGHQCLLMAQTV